MYLRTYADETLILGGTELIFLKYKIIAGKVQLLTIIPRLDCNGRYIACLLAKLKISRKADGWQLKNVLSSNLESFSHQKRQKRNLRIT